MDPIAPLQGDRAARLDEPTPDQVRGDERRAAPAPAPGRRWEIPAVSRFLVNTPAALGGIGATTQLFPALTLGCGAVGGSSSSNNISPMDLINIRRVAWGTEEKQPQIKEETGDLVEQITRRILQQLEREGRT